MGNYYGRFSLSGRGMVSAGKLVGGTIVVYDPTDGKLHYDSRHQKMYDEGDYDEISDEEFEKFKAKMDAKWSEKKKSE